MSFWGGVLESERSQRHMNATSTTATTTTLTNTTLSERSPLVDTNNKHYYIPPPTRTPTTSPINTEKQKTRSSSFTETISDDIAADELSNALLALNTDDEEQNYQVLRRSLYLENYDRTSKGGLRIPRVSSVDTATTTNSNRHASIIQNHLPRVPSADAASSSYKSSKGSLKSLDVVIPQPQPMMRPIPDGEEEKTLAAKAGMICCLAVVVIVSVAGVLLLGEVVVGPPRQPAGPYRVVEVQEGESFWDSYVFYEGPDSVGSNGYINYVSKAKALELGIAKITHEPISPFDTPPTSSSDPPSPLDATPPLSSSKPPPSPPPNNNTTTPTEPFIHMSSSATPLGPRNSIRLEGKRRFNRGLFILDVRHMPSGCGTWPAFWLTDEDNWPVNGEIDILEGVNFQTSAKTALHSTKGCVMDDIPRGVKTGTWDTAVGIPDKKTGVPDMTMRYATDCFVYNPHQWLNQGCVAVDDVDGRIGEPLNEMGGGVYALEWDPINRHIRSWIFAPHGGEAVPENLREAMATAKLAPGRRVAPDTNEWGLPYGYFAVGDDTSCDASHFKNMRLVINLAFCGSVAGNRYFMDCPNQFKKFPTCNQWIKSNPKELEEAYWKIRGVYVYEREWQKVWL